MQAMKETKALLIKTGTVDGAVIWPTPLQAKVREMTDAELETGLSGLMALEKTQTTVAEPMQRLSIDLPESLRKRLKILAAEQNTSIRDIVLRCVNTEIQK